MRKKIALIINTINGLYLFRRELVEAVIDNYDVVIIAPDGPRKEYFLYLGCEIIETPMDSRGINPITEYKLLKTYKRILSREKPDIVFTYTIKPNTYAGMACASLKIPYVSNITGLGTAVEKPGILQIISIILYKHGLRKCQRVFFQNSQSRAFMMKHKMVPKDKCSTIPGSGVNLKQFVPIEYPKKDTVDFAFISRIIKEKGIDQYLEAAECIGAKYPNTRFHVCGGCGDGYLNILKEKSDKGVIVYHGFIQDVREIHKISSCTVLPSYYPEGVSNVLLESAACARPIITTDKPGCKETVDDGKSGYIVKQKDSQDLIEKLEMFLNLSWEEQKRMGLAGRTKVEQEFDRNIVIEQYMEEIKSV